MSGSSDERGAVSRRGIAIVVVVLVVAFVGTVLALGTGDDEPAPARAGGGFLTLLFGRAIWTSANACRPLPGAVDLERVALDLAADGRSATTAPVVDRVDDSTRRCFTRTALQASWSDLARLRDDFDWSVVSDGLTHEDMRTMSPDEQRRESCGSLPVFERHGFTRAWGLFAYGNNTWSDDAQRDVVSKCFAYGRRYRGGTNVRAEMAPPWFQSTNSVLGGRCNDETLPCARIPVPNERRYWLPEDIERLFPAADEWTVLQFYRLVSGSNRRGPLRWDCRADDPRAHWTSLPEAYCYEDFRAVVDALPARVRTVDPAAVAEAWGRAPDPTTG